jgi:MFS transporter, PPP family, 3-phenylpropionic acid transporter
MTLPALSLYWFLYLAAFGILLPFFSLYLSDNAGLSGTEVGVVVTMSPLVALFAPTGWGRIADRSGSPTRVLAVATLGVAIFTAAFVWLDGFWLLAAGAAALALFTTGVIPLLISVTLLNLGENALPAFGRVRVWGTVGFLVLVVLFPLALRACDVLGAHSSRPAGPSEPYLWVMFPAASALTLLATWIAWRIPEPGGVKHHVHRSRWLELRRHGPFVRLLMSSFGTYLFLQGPMNLFPLYLRAHGRGLETLSQMWILMLLLEIPLIAFSGTALRHLGPRGLVRVGLAAGGLRWLVCGLVRDLRAVYAVQLLHGVTVAGVGVGSALYVESSVPARLRSTGQGLNATAGVGIGSILSNLVAGWLMDHAGVDVPFIVGGGGALLLAMMVPAWLPPPSGLGQSNAALGSATTAASDQAGC